MVIRMAKKEDAGHLLAIYNYEVENGVATFDLEPKSLDEWMDWFHRHNIDNHPLLVAEVDGVIAGYASLSSYRDKEAFRSTVELSVYVSAQYRHKGVATALMQTILEKAKQDSNTHLVVSVITSGNEVSTRLHKRFGFTYCGTIHEAGLKFGKYWGIDNYELTV